MKKKIFFITSYILLISTVLVMCTEDEPLERSYPQINTLEVDNISDTGATLHAEIVNQKKLDIVEYGFAWSEYADPSIANSEKTTLSKNISNGYYSARISAALKKDATYYVRAFVKTKDITVYGKQISFISLGAEAPVLESFAPSGGTWGDTIKIYGKNFSQIKSNNIIKFGDIPSVVLNATENMLTVVVPAEKNNLYVDLSVSIHGNVAVSETKFINYTSEIVSVVPISGTFGDTITINGEHLSKIDKYNSVFLNTFQAHIITISENELKFIVPDEITSKENTLKLVSMGVELLHNEKFSIEPPEIISFAPEKIIKPNQLITIVGKNFSPIANNNKISIGDLRAQIINVTNDSIQVELPDGIIPDYFVSLFDNFSISVEVAEQITVSSNTIEVYWESTWTKKNDFPGKERFGGVAFSINGKGYFGTGITQNGVNSYEYFKDFWEYDPMLDKWTQLNDFPGAPRTSASTFTIFGEAYVGLGSGSYYWSDPVQDQDHFIDFYKYNAMGDSWTQIQDFGGIGRHSAASFSINNKGYITTGWWGNDDPGTGSKISADTWMYDPILNHWEKTIDFPNASYFASGFNIGNTGFVYDYNKLFKFSNEEWIQLDANELRAWNIVAFSIDDMAYYGLGLPHDVGGSNNLWEYNPSNGNLLNRPLSYKDSRWGASSFVIDGKAYIICGATYNYGYIMLKEVWEFDPSKPDI